MYVCMDGWMDGWMCVSARVHVEASLEDILACSSGVGLPSCPLSASGPVSSPTGLGLQVHATMPLLPLMKVLET